MVSLSMKVRTGLGVVVAYTAYSTYMQLRTSYLISERARKRLLESDLREHASEWPAIKFSTMTAAGRFVNPFTEYRPHTVFEFLYCRIIELFHAKPRGGVPQDPVVIAQLLPTRQPDFDLLFRTSREYALGGSKSALSLSSLLGIEPTEPELPPIENRMTLTWLGQSCAYIQLPGFNILTDPCLGDHLVSQYLGPKRISPPPCKLDELPPVDVVLVSHDHPDHFELETADEIGNSALWIVPLGVAKRLAKRGITNVRELDWWDTASLPLPSRHHLEPSIASDTATPGLEVSTSPTADSPWQVACTPAMHWSGRNMIDSNTTLWCSFMILRHGKPVFYHAGDTGYSANLFTGIRKVLGSGCQVAMLPCGAYTPRWHLRPQHTDPFEAFQIMKDLGAHKMIGVHWGTFVMSDEHFLEPRDKLHEVAKKGHRENDVIAPEFGRTIVFRLDHEDKTRNRKESIRDDFALLMD